MFVSDIKPLSSSQFSPAKPQPSLRGYIGGRKHYLSAKRIFDICLSAFVILFIMSWLFPIVALLIRLSSKGGILFVQKRVGFLGRTFNCYKFRTMVVNRESDSRQAIQNDPRITRIGNFLRKSNLDELPQFFNVLLGDMSVVGPRPHMHSDCRSFSNVVDNYKFRNIAKPGITGLAQIKGFRGPAKTFETIYKRYQWDAFYVRNANFWLDLRIVRITAAQTLSIMLKHFLHRSKTVNPKVVAPKVYRKLLVDMKQRMNTLI